MSKQKNTGKSRKMNSKQIALTVLCVVLGLILTVLLVGTVYMESMLGRINRHMNDSTMSPEEYQEYLNSLTETVDPNYTGVTLNPEDVTWDPVDDPLVGHEGLINILLIGQDRRPGQGRTHSDSMILCTINTRDKTLTMTSFMRDMYVQIPGYQDDRINTSYMLGGMPLLDACLKKNFGVQVDGNIEVDFAGFAGVIDVVGGVEMELTTAEAEHLNKKYGWDLHSGLNLLDGKRALGYARNRSVGNSDFERTNRQRKVLSAVFDKCKNLSPAQLHSLLMEILPMLTTDMSNSQIVSLAGKLIPMLPSLTIDNLRIPGDGMYRNATIRGMMVLVPDLQANRNLLQKSIYG